jgi:hypothetical protein
MNVEIEKARKFAVSDPDRKARIGLAALAFWIQSRAWDDEASVKNTLCKTKWRIAVIERDLKGQSPCKPKPKLRRT